jgi:hypothetical protein
MNGEYDHIFGKYALIHGEYDLRNGENDLIHEENDLRNGEFDLINAKNDPKLTVSQGGIGVRPVKIAVCQVKNAV